MLVIALECAVIILMTVVLYKLVTGTIRTRGLFSDCHGTRINPERLQAFVISLASIGSYALSVVHQRASGMHVTTLPEVPNVLIHGVLASQALYLIGKFIRWNK